MAENTARLDLLKKNPATDGADTFNIETMLNENWQKIDDKVALVDASGKVINKDGTPAGGSVGVDLASTALGKGASLVAIHDADNLFTATTVEGALKEAFTFANDGKTAVAGAVTAKGVTASPSDTFPTLATKIGQINTGKKYATGTVSSSGTTLPFVKGNGVTASTVYYPITVTGIAFKPSIIIAISKIAGSGRVSIYNKDGISVDGNFSVGNMIDNGTTSTETVTVRETGNAYVNVTGFQMVSILANVLYTWHAFE